MLTRTPVTIPGARHREWSQTFAMRAGTMLADPPACGLTDLDHAGVLRPGALTLVDAGTYDPVYAWMADTAVRGMDVLVADGGNFLDVYRLAAAARRRAAARYPGGARGELATYEELALDRVRLARGFTAYQLQTIIEDILPAAAMRSEGEGEGGGEVGLICAPGLLDMYLDDELSREEAHTLVGRALSSLRRLAGRLHVPAIVANSVLSPRSDHPLRVLLDESVDEHVVLAPAPQGGVSIHLPRRGAAFLAPGPGRTRLEDFLEPEAGRAVPAARYVRRKPGAWVSNGNRMFGKFGEARRREPWAVMAARDQQEAQG